MQIRLILAAAVAFGLAAGAVEARECRPVHAVRPKPACLPCHAAYHHHRRHVRVTQKLAVLRGEARFDDRAYRFAEADERGGSGAYGGQVWGPVRPSPPHPWDTDPNGYLTWPGKNQPYVGQDRYSGNPRPYDPRNDGCPDNCPLGPPAP